jgi:hypothetical protein
MSDKQTLFRERSDVFGKPIQCVTWFDRYLAGFTHPNKKGLNRLELIKKLERGSKIVLVPEPDNTYDRNAILLYSSDDLENDIGYLDSIGAKQICGLVERGATFSAEVFDVWYRKPNSPYVRIMIYQLSPALQNHRPIRKGAPVYRPQSSMQVEKPAMVQPRSERVEMHRFDEPVAVQLAQVEPEGIWSSLKRLIGL